MIKGGLQNNDRYFSDVVLIDYGYATRYVDEHNHHKH